MAFNIAPSEDERSLLVSGDLRIENAVAIRDRLLAALDSGKDIRLVIDANASIDLSFLQLVCALHREALKRGITAGAMEGWSGTLRKTAAAAGFLRRRCCRVCPGGSCFLVPDEAAA